MKLGNLRQHFKVTSEGVWVEKQKFNSPGEALGQYGHDGWTVYECQVCGFWHLAKK